MQTRKSQAVEIHCRSLAVESVSAQDGWIVGVVLAQPLPRLDFAPTINPRRAFAGVIRKRTISAVAPLFFGNLGEPTSDILETFHRLKRGDTGGAAEFTRRFGVFRQDDLLLKRSDDVEVPSHVAKFWRAATRRGSVPFASPLSEFWDCHETIESLLRIYLCLQEPTDTNAASIIDACKNVGPKIVARFNLSKNCDPVQTGKRLFMAGVTGGLRDVSLAMFENRGATVAGVSSAFACDALYVELLLRVTGGRASRECTRCGELFQPSRDRQRYCTPTCQNLAKRYRQLARNHR
jgi:hypothetical protein